MSIGQIKSNCKTATPLTGAESCAKQEGKVSALIVTGLNAYFPLEDTDFTDELGTHVYESGPNRIYPIKNIVGMTISGGDINAPDLGTYGGPAPTNLNAKNVAYQINAGDCMYKELAKFNKRKVRVIRVDDEGYAYGTIVKRGSEYFFAGYEGTLYTQRTPTDGSTAYNLSLFVYYTPNNEDEEKNMAAINVGLVNVPDGLLGVTLKKGTASGSATVITACGAEDITSEYGEKWKAKMFLNASGGSPTTVTYNQSTGTLTFEPAAAYRIAPASVLNADIPGIEGINELTDLS